jgi:hypothetical protein
LHLVKSCGWERLAQQVWRIWATRRYAQHSPWRFPAIFQLSPKWVCSSWDGSCAVIYDGIYFYDVAVSVVKKTGVTNPGTTSKVRYEVTLAYTRYIDSIGRVVDIENNTLYGIDIVNLNEAIMLGSVTITAASGLSDTVQLYQQVFHLRYEFNGKALAEFKTVVHDVGEHRTSSRLMWMPIYSNRYLR